ncbi:MAG: glycoside hydrolase family 130 protein [Candidatus Limnocylindrales bacterium]
MTSTASTASSPATSFALRRLDLVIEPDPKDPQEAEGILNPAAVRGPDGALYLFPRLVARGNYSRIGIARVSFGAGGDPVGIERLGVALEPEAEYERRPDGGGCEDPRITYVEALRRYVMAYTALSADGPRIALAVSEDLLSWRRMGLATFSPYHHLSLSSVDDKDASFFPVAIPNPSGIPELGLIHRPLFPGTRPEEIAGRADSREVDLHRESIWISYCEMALGERKRARFGRFTAHHRLAAPVAPWEQLKIGGGTPPILTRHGWLIVYHGVSEPAEGDDGVYGLRYSAGIMVLDRDHPREIRYRSAQPVLTPASAQERSETAKNVVFPTGIDRRVDLGLPDRYDVYFGISDDRIGVACLDVPEHLPEDAVVGPRDS